MRSWSVVLLTALFLGGCAWLDNQGRPAYHGPVVAPIWHAADIDVIETPVIRADTVYALGQPGERRGDSHATRLYAFALHTGTLRWSVAASHSTIVGVAGPFVYLGDRGTEGAYGHDPSGVASAVDARTGRSAAGYVPLGTTSVAESDGITYATVGNGSIKAFAADGATLWSRTIPKGGAAIVAGGPTLYVRSVKLSEYDDSYTQWVVVLDRKTGAVLRTLSGKDLPGGVHQILADDRRGYVEEALTENSMLTHLLIVTLDGRNGRTAWQHRSTDVCTYGPALAAPNALVTCDDELHDANGTVYVALDRTNGSILWQGKTSWDYTTYTAYDRYAVVSDRQTREYLNENGDKTYDSWVTLVDLRTGAEIWRSAVLDRTNLTPAAVAPRIAVVGSDVDGLLAFALP